MESVKVIDPKTIGLRLVIAAKNGAKRHARLLLEYGLDQRQVSAVARQTQLIIQQLERLEREIDYKKGEV